MNRTNEETSGDEPRALSALLATAARRRLRVTFQPAYLLGQVDGRGRHVEVRVSDELIVPRDQARSVGAVAHVGPDRCFDELALCLERLLRALAP